MKEIKAKLWIVVFLIIIATPKLTYSFLEQYMDTGNYENRDKLSKPIFSVDNYEGFPRDYEQFYNDNLPFRNLLIRLNHSIDYFVFKQSSNKNVELGADGWLFYCNDEDNNAVEQSLGYWEFSEAELEMILNNLQSAKQAFDSLGIEFVLFIAPNKETIYKENLPEFYPVKSEVTSADQLVAYLTEHSDIEVVYPKNDLLKDKKDFPQIFFYHKLDTHWNNAGGYLGASYLADKLNITMPSFDEIHLEKKLSSSGDLTDMLNIQIKDGDIDYELSGITNLVTECEKWDFHTEFIYHTEGADDRRLFVERDSFATALAPYLATQFHHSIFVHKDSFTQQQILDYQPDIFVLEMVERNIRDLMDFNISYSSAD